MRHCLILNLNIIILHYLGEELCGELGDELCGELCGELGDELCGELCGELGDEDEAVPHLYKKTKNKKQKIIFHKNLVKRLTCINFVVATKKRKKYYHYLSRKNIIWLNGTKKESRFEGNSARSRRFYCFGFLCTQ
jgi:hypothetical protein